jgi:hypothetical protein
LAPVFLVDDVVAGLELRAFVRCYAVRLGTVSPLALEPGSIA